MDAFVPLESLLFHEVWICLQHANVLFNPLCQRLDRNYGISLFKNDMVWVIAFTLSAYWLREIVSMSLCYNLVSPSTQQLILVSSGYHAFKIINVNIDAWRKWSPKLGILRLLLDYWHFDTVVNCIISFKRMFLQGFDTAVHGCIIYDILHSDNSMEKMTIFFSSKKSLVAAAGLIWFIHALAVQISRKSTATMMVELYRKIAIFLGLVEPSKNAAENTDSVQLPSIRESKFRHTNDKTKGTTLGSFLGPHIHTIHKSSHDCVVCRMLAEPTHNANSAKLCGPDVVFLAHPMQLSSAFSLWADKGSDKEKYWRASWWMENIVVSSIVFFISIAVYPIGMLCFKCSPVVIVDKSSHTFQKKASHHLDTESDNILPSVATRSEVWFAKSFGWQYISSSPFWQGYARETVVRSALLAQNQGVKVLGLGALNKAHWLNNGGEGVVTSLERRSPQGDVLTPLDVELGLLKEESSTHKIKIVHGNTLTAAVVCYQLTQILHDHIAHQKTLNNGSTEHCTALTVIIIGATSKIGRAVVLTMAATEYVRVVCVGSRSKRLDNIIEEGRLAGIASGKGGQITSCTDVLSACECAADAVWLLGKGDRSSPLADIIPLGSRVLSYAVPCPLSVLEGYSVCGSEKNDKRNMGGRCLMRDDLRYLDAGVMVLPLEMQTQRQFALMLPNHLVYTCHAAAIVHHLEGWEHHEVGEVALDNMEVTLKAAVKHGFSASLMPSHKESNGQYGQRDGQKDGRTVDVTVIGCGPGGLAAAACLLSNDSTAPSMGTLDLIPGWLSQYEGLTLTSRGQHSALPHLKIPDCLFDTKIPPERDGTQISRNLNSTNTKNHILFPNENENYHSSKGNEKQNYNSKNKRSEKELSAESYVRYLRMYARRFGLDSTMRLGCSVVKVSRLPATSVCGESAGGVSTVGYPPRDDMWEVQYSFTDINGERKLAVLYSKCVVVACGKAQIPISDHNLTEALKGFSGQTVYAKDVKDIEALARSGCVLIVGCGNSALDLCASLRGARSRLSGGCPGVSEDSPKGSGSCNESCFGVVGGEKCKETGVCSDIVHMSMRTVPPCIPRQWGPLAVEEVSVWILQYLPVYTADVIVWLFYRLYRMIRGNSRNKKGRILGGKINPDWYPFSSHRVPPIDKGGFTEALGEGKVLLHSCIAEAKGRKIMFQSNPGSGSREGHTVEDSLDTDVIVLCTGYRADWSWLHIPLPLSLPLSLPLPLPLLRSTVTAIIPSPPMSSLPQNTLSYHGEVKTLDRDSVLSEFARLRSLSPITCTDGLFFIGYDPGPALIPLSAIRNQAKIIAKTARKLLFSEFKSVTVK